LIKYEALKELLYILKVNNNLINNGKIIVDGGMAEPMQKIVLKVALNLMCCGLMRVNSMLPSLMTNNGYMCMFMS
jgi:hypothetical protein